MKANKLEWQAKCQAHLESPPPKLPLHSWALNPGRGFNCLIELFRLFLLEGRGFQLRSGSSGLKRLKS